MWPAAHCADGWPALASAPSGCGCEANQHLPHPESVRQTPKCSCKHAPAAQAESTMPRLGVKLCLAHTCAVAEMRKHAQNKPMKRCA
jgi:hypothetical protein